MTTYSKPENFTILLVDDREENLVSLEEILEKEGRLFIKAHSGNEALKIALKNEDIGLIMLDIQMPVMDGYEVAQLLKSNSKTKDISIIFVTAINNDAAHILKGFETGAVDYLQKPLDIEVTRAKVKVFEHLYFMQRKLKTTATELQKINEQLQQFVYIVAHDIKSPLASIVTILSLLETDETVLANPELYDYVNMLFSASHHLSGMITSILDNARTSLGQQTLEEVNTGEMVKQIAHLLFPPKPMDIRIQEHMPVFKTKKLKIQQVFQNLISNAIKYNDKKQGKIEIGCSEEGDFYRFFVKDNGPGISEADQDKVFRLFQTTGNKSEHDSSTGIGLNIIKMSLEEEGGKIWLESKVGEGTTFFFEIKKSG